MDGARTRMIERCMQNVRADIWQYEDGYERIINHCSRERLSEDPENQEECSNDIGNSSITDNWQSMGS